MTGEISVTLSDGSGTLIDACDLHFLDQGRLGKTPIGYVYVALYAPHPRNRKVLLSRCIMDVQVNHTYIGRRSTLHEAEQLAREARRRMMTHSVECCNDAHREAGPA